MFSKIIKKMGTLTMVEWAIVKICLITFALMCATLIPALLQVQRRVYGIIFIATYAYLIRRVLIKRQ
ncbi:MAG: hypothetical protein WCJ81_02320 [bacterium]